MFTNRNRIDLRKFDGENTLSWRYRNRSQIEKPFTVLDHQITGFASYEIYYDSCYNKMGQRNRLIAGVSVPIKEWLSVDVFYGYHIESKPKYETGGAIGIAIGLYF